ncbi:polysaccharide deacetylase family protein [Paenibacillus sp. JDR-2]|uniref:polysaccharide deacetylase family protein n=1 Tax=Paenibacillus sp. (strain JDR-2) TaxID=324057 RepID=UPI0001668202|nr:polysaccharide deacetylase family protein [Paenibacillus sp. JDR-2]ACT01324.1 YdjC family protein [Paenibacillus sp. JDR-2]
MNVAASLGYGSQERLLIINADDYGLCQSTNKGIQQLLQEQAVSSATLMMPCKSSREAALWSANRPQFDVGIHFTFTSEWDSYRWGPVLNGSDTQSLVTAEGYFPKDCRSFELQAEPQQVKKEMIAQIEAALQLGMNPTHADNHMGSLYGLETGKNFLKEVFEVCAAYGLPFRMPRKVAAVSGQMVPPELEEQARQLGLLAHAMGVVVLDYLIGLPFPLKAGDTYDTVKTDLKQQLKQLQPGVTELIFHPSLVTDELLAFHGQPEKRGMEFQLFRDPDVQQALRSEGIRLIRWRDLQQLQSTVYGRP